MRVLSVLCLTCVLCGISCLSTSPSSSEFLITDIQFTGDSAGTGSSLPFCEFTLLWTVPENGGTLFYTLYRSPSSSIQADPSVATVVGVTADNTGTDSSELEWGTDYFYAVLAENSAGDSWWSSEVSSATPVSPFPAPCQLSQLKTGFTECSLSWTAAEESFKSYTVLRSTEPGIPGILWYSDTLYATTDLDSVFFTDSLASSVESSYYVVAVEDSSGLSGFSNEVEFISGGDVPWRISVWKRVLGLDADNYSVSDNGTRMYTSVKRTGYSVGYVLDTAQGAPLNHLCADVEFLGELSDGSFGVGLDLTTGHRFALYHSDLSEEIVSRPFPPVLSMADTEEGLLLGTASTTELLDQISLETLHTASFGCREFILSSEGSRVFVLNSSGVLMVNLPDLSVAAGISGSYSSIRMGSDGNIRCSSSTRVEVYDAESLSLIRMFVFPQQADKDEVILLPPECNVVYVPVYEDDRLVFRVWDTLTGESPGSVRPEHVDLVDLEDILASPQGDFLWCLGYQADMSRTLFRISL